MKSKWITKNPLEPLAGLKLSKPGLFITATDTSVGKTVTTCAIAWSLRQMGQKVSVCKPMATGCRHDREGLVSTDAEAIAHFSDCRLALDVINPVRYVPPVSPAAAAEALGKEVDFEAIARSLGQLDAWGDVMLVEGVGGLCAPISASQPRLTVLDLILAIGYPVLIVTRAGLGTLNHTAMTVRLLQQAGASIAGLVVNGYVADPGDPNTVQTSTTSITEDASMASNRRWLERMNRQSILATLPRSDPSQVQPELGVLPDELLDAAMMTRWEEYLRQARPVVGGQET